MRLMAGAPPGPTVITRMRELSARIVRVLVAVNDEPSRRILVRALDSPHIMVRIAASGGVLSVYGDSACISP